MSEFNFKSRKNLVKVTIEGKEYAFDVSPTNFAFVKNVATMAKEVQDLSERIGLMDKSNWGAIEEAFDTIKAKQKVIIDSLLPGAWDELYKASGEDLLGMVELIVYIGTEIQNGAAKAKVNEVMPVAPGGEKI